MLGLTVDDNTVEHESQGQPGLNPASAEVTPVARFHMTDFISKIMAQGHCCQNHGTNRTCPASDRYGADFHSEQNGERFRSIILREK